MGEVFLSRSLLGAQAQGLTALDCIGWPDPVGGMGLRLFFAIGASIRAFDTQPREGCARLTAARGINGGVMFDGQHAEVSADVQIALKKGTLTLPVTPPETALFADMNVAIVERNGESVDVIEQWISYHRAPFGLDALLLVDRAAPGEINAVEGDLQVLATRSGLKRFVHLSAPVPLGHPTLPAASHPFNAPDAPGQDRMEGMTHDPWASPLREVQIYELLKWRFLSKARAVMNLDLTDLLQPGQDPFRAVHDSSAGVLQLLGQRIYPWRVRPGAAPGFGDHICRPFDNPRANRRWCVAPARVGADKVWRLVRISDATPQTEERAHFWRAMAIRHSESSAAEIVPKTSLIEDPDLLRMAAEVWDHKPVRPPENKIAKAPVAASKAGRTLIVTCMKNEGPFILEWIAHHRAIGVEDFLVYTNDCDDGTDAMLDALMARGIVERRDNRFHGTALRPQHWALAAAEKEPLFKKAGWVISMDADEFINIHVGQGRLPDLYAAIGEANMISLTWRLFGNADVAAFEDRFVTEQFTRCAPQLSRKPHQAWGFKTLFRNLGIYKKMGVHRPKGLKPDLWEQVNWVNGSGQPMPQKLIRNGWRSTIDSYGYDLVTLNHYAVRSAESFLVKRDRGRVNHVERDQGLNYWFRMNNNWEEDRTILTKRDMVRAEFDALMADPEVASLHAACVAHHRAKITALRAADSYAAFYEELTSPRMNRLARLHPHFGANVFLEGPGSVPEDLPFRDDLAPDFFFTVKRGETTD